MKKGKGTTQLCREIDYSYVEPGLLCSKSIDGINFMCLLPNIFMQKGKKVGCSVYLVICQSCRMAALMLCYHSITPRTCKGDIRASAICHI